MLFESLEARRLMSVVSGNPATLYGIQATQSGSGTLQVHATVNNAQVSVIEAGTRNDPGFISSYGAGDVAVIDANGNAVIFNNLSSKQIQIQGGGGGTTVLFDGKLHNANVNLGGTNAGNTVTLIDEGAGGSVIGLGGGVNNVNVPFSHNVKINDGGGYNNIAVNTDFYTDTVVTSNTVTQTDWNETVMLRNNAADLSTVQLGGGINYIEDYAGNLNFSAGGGYNVIAIQGESGTVNNPPKMVSTAYVVLTDNLGGGTNILEGTN